MLPAQRQVLVDGQPAALGARAFGLRLLGFRYDEAERAIQRALGLAPSLMDVQYCAGTLKPFIGQGDASLAHFEQALRISPVVVPYRDVELRSRVAKIYRAIGVPR